MTKFTREQKFKLIELVIKVIGVLLTIFGIIIGLIQYADKKEHENFMEFKRTVWKKQMETYTKACKYAGLIANHPNDTSLQENIKEFGGLYWGEMIMVEDSLVEKAMKEFYYAAKDFLPGDQKGEFKLKYKAKLLAETCRESSKITWDQIKTEE